MGYFDLVAGAERAAQDLLGGESVTYAPEVGDPVPVVGIFDESHVLEDGGFVGANQTVPTVTLRLADLPSDPRTDNPTLTIRDTEYTVRERITDGLPSGSIMLLLTTDVA